MSLLKVQCAQEAVFLTSNPGWLLKSGKFGTNALSKWTM